MPTDLPILIISGADDPVGDWGKGPQKVYQKLQKAGFNHLKLQLFPELRHEILFETEYEEVYHTIGDWLMQHLPQ